MCSHLTVTLHEAGCPQTTSRKSHLLCRPLCQKWPSGFLAPMDLELSSKALFLHDYKGTLTFSLVFPRLSALLLMSRAVVWPKNVKRVVPAAFMCVAVNTKLSHGSFLMPILFRRIDKLRATLLCGKVWFDHLKAMFL